MLLCLFCFDILTFIVRTLQLTLGYRAAQREWGTFVPQFINMALLWTGIHCINRHSRKGHGKRWAAFQVGNPRARALTLLAAMSFNSNTLLGCP